jgi:DNA-binding transcriptional LysR family regulator
MILCASPNYLSRHGPIKTHHDLIHHPWVAITIFPDIRHVQLYDGSGTKVNVEVALKFRTNSGFTAKQLVAEGAAIGLLPDYAVTEDLAQGRLVRVLPEWSHRPGEICAIYVHRERMPPRIRYFIDFLKQDAARHFQ